jgi:hypothetical protein
MSLRPLACWDCGFESRQRHGSLSSVIVVCCQVAVTATSRSLIQRSPTECDVSVIEEPRRGSLGPLRLSAIKKLKMLMDVLITLVCYNTCRIAGSLRHYWNIRSCVVKLAVKDME